MLKLPRKDKMKKGKMEGRKGKRRKRQREGVRKEWGSISGQRKELCMKKQKCLACYQEGKNFIESCQSNGRITVDFAVQVLRF